LGGLENLWRERHIPARKRLTMEKGYWICRDCAGVYHIPLDTSNTSRIGSGRIHLVSKMGICPMCGYNRQLYKAEPLKETGTAPDLEKQEGIECQPTL